MGPHPGCPRLQGKQSWQHRGFELFFQAVRSIAWQYDPYGQVTNANHSADDTFDRTYQYDAIGNRLQSGAGVSPAAITTYTPNALNQYTAITQGSAGVSPAYDDDGNATAYPLPVSIRSNSTLTWDAENRLIETTVGTSGPLVRNYYDSQFRRIATTTGSNTS